MRRALAAPIACAAVILIAGCGSSGSSSSSSGSTASTSSTASSGLKATTTPKYAAPSASSPVQSGVVQIAYRNIAIDPDTLKVKVGSTLKWTNYDSVEHNVTSEGGPQKFASKDFGENGTFEIKANKPGVIHYQCTIHPASMNGTIEVVK
ncbi:MAG TPA: plastocyanin/azurin family copper-binding protein [Solirubrobacteraceae bacterium]|nr:plastocyanin/azurin family copper-binding protein [Solirubrobacteraceae bacterium]